ncbi:hypothetical protein TorRG33x02_082910 [Trema orientale]|uniref:Uncharacterized protein n=1 Tax=Trema orientale TaxID=63057 RepID=A0A2P5FE28_TREOI|nr:hypothetical protein TorRG33x02_082910 [Trema orientale]
MKSQVMSQKKESIYHIKNEIESTSINGYDAKKESIYHIKNEIESTSINGYDANYSYQKETLFLFFAKSDLFIVISSQVICKKNIMKYSNFVNLSMYFGLRKTISPYFKFLQIYTLCI